MKARIRLFFSPTRQYVVAGASNNPNKFGFKILLWYFNHELNVVPVNPREDLIVGEPVVSSVKILIEAFTDGKDVGKYKLSLVDGLSISFLTPPKVTVKTLEDIANTTGYESAIKGLWFQPGSYDQEVLDVAEKIGLASVVIEEDECILVRGEEGLYSPRL